MIKIMSPIQLWSDYNPTALPLDLTVVKQNISGNICTEYVYFTSELSAEGKVRAFVKIYRPVTTPTQSASLPAVIVVPSADSNRALPYLSELATEGYIVAEVDYAGAKEGKSHHTMYPPDMEYCNCAVYDQNPGHITDVKSTCWYHWSVLVRRAVTAVASISFADPGRMMLLGCEQGSYIGCQVAAMDGRITHAGFIIGYKPSMPQGLNDDERTAWISCAHPLSYAKYLSVPLLCADATDNESMTIQDWQAFIGGLPDSTPVTHTLAIGYTKSLSMSDYNTVLSFVRTLNGVSADAIEPKLSVDIGDDGIKATLDTGTTAAICQPQIWQAHYRNGKFGKWRLLKLSPTDSAGVYQANIKVYEPECDVYIVGKVLTDAGTRSADAVRISLPAGSHLIKAHPHSKVIYNTDLPTEELWVMEEDSGIVCEESVSIIKGARGLSGVRASSGTIVFKRDDDKWFEMDRLTCIQLEAYVNGDSDREVTIGVKDNGPQGEDEYTAVYTLPADGCWHRLTVELNDLKNKNMQSMAEWDNYYLIRISGVKDVLLNNIQWL